MEDVATDVAPVTPVTPVTVEHEAPKQKSESLKLGLSWVVWLKGVTRGSHGGPKTTPDKLMERHVSLEERKKSNHLI